MGWLSPVGISTGSRWRCVSKMFKGESETTLQLVKPFRGTLWLARGYMILHHVCTGIHGHPVSRLGVGLTSHGCRLLGCKLCVRVNEGLDDG
jgi:hypothetical protein